MYVCLHPVRMVNASHYVSMKVQQTGNTHADQLAGAGAYGTPGYGVNAYAPTGPVGYAAGQQGAPTQGYPNAFGVSAPGYGGDYSKAAPASGYVQGAPQAYPQQGSVPNNQGFSFGGETFYMLTMLLPIVPSHLSGYSIATSSSTSHSTYRTC